MPELFPRPLESFLGFWVITGVGAALAVSNSGDAKDD